MKDFRFLGFIFIGIGILFFLQKAGVIHIAAASAWPFLFIMLSAGFHAGFLFTGKASDKAGLLVPGGITLVLGCLFCFETATGWAYASITWPVYIWAPALGLFELWFFGGRKTGVLIPVFILSAVGAVCFAGMLMAEAWPLLIILVSLIFHISAFLYPQKRTGLLIPGGILLITGGLLWFETLTDWAYADVTWPVYLFAVSFGLFESWLFGKKQKGLLIASAVLVCIGIFGIFSNTNAVINEHGWPAILILFGIAFHIPIFSSKPVKNAGLLVPGGILLITGVLFFFEIATNWSYSGVTWPVYLLAAAFGLFELWLFGGKQKALLIPITVLTLTALCFIMMYQLVFPVSVFWPVLFILIGIMLMVFPGKKRRV
ncbi:hypothetical protein [Bacillus nakamurai]|uniref:hypothetical protein n=1 Tax=Bacillus nakamurai TaxID=1793963 RepID=UPI001E5B26CC|nr:hypothetical protein [Bacillus nakamurai]MCC9024118.1 hypothetical protein [Bacillus nakamurai]